MLSLNNLRCKRVLTTDSPSDSGPCGLHPGMWQQQALRARELRPVCRALSALAPPLTQAPQGSDPTPSRLPSARALPTHIYSVTGALLTVWAAAGMLASLP